MDSKKLTLGDIEYASRKKLTRREEFLQAMDGIYPLGGLD